MGVEGIPLTHMSLMGHENDGSLDGRVVLTTGGGRGIGAAVAVAAAQAGANVAIGYHEQKAAAESVVTRIRSIGRTAEAIQADVSDPSGAGHLVATVVAMLARGDLPYASGQTLTVDWGLSVQRL